MRFFSDPDLVLPLQRVYWRWDHRFWLGHWKQTWHFSVSVTLRYLCQWQALAASSVLEVLPKLQFMLFLWHVAVLSLEFYRHIVIDTWVFSAILSLDLTNEAMVGLEMSDYISTLVDLKMQTILLLQQLSGPRPHNAVVSFVLALAMVLPHSELDQISDLVKKGLEKKVRWFAGSAARHCSSWHEEVQKHKTEEGKETGSFQLPCSLCLAYTGHEPASWASTCVCSSALKWVVPFPENSC